MALWRASAAKTRQQGVSPYIFASENLQTQVFFGAFVRQNIKTGVRPHIFVKQIVQTAVRRNIIFSQKRKTSGNPRPRSARKCRL